MLVEAIRTYFAGVATLIFVVAYVVYFVQTKRGTSVPNMSTWTIWVALTLMNFGTYFKASGDLVTSAFPMVSSIACIVTFAVLFRAGTFKLPTFWDTLALVIGLAAGLAWWQFDDPLVGNLIQRFVPKNAEAPMVTNLMLQFAIAVSFAPTYADAWLRKSETPLPWALWTATRTSSSRSGCAPTSNGRTTSTPCRVS